VTPYHLSTSFHIFYSRSVTRTHFHSNNLMGREASNLHKLVVRLLNSASCFVMFSFLYHGVRSKRLFLSSFLLLRFRFYFLVHSRMVHGRHRSSASSSFNLSAWCPASGCSVIFLLPRVDPFCLTRTVFPLIFL
jgi:hypothetical protein